MTQPAAAPAASPRTVLARRLLMAAAACVALAAVTYLLMVRTRLGQRFDNAAVLGAQQLSPTSRLHVAFFLERIRAGTFAVVLVAIAAIGVLRRRPRAGFALALAAFVAAVGVDLAKKHILTRPRLALSDALGPANSFPSGHTATAIGCALALVVLSPPVLRGLVAVLAGSYSWIVAADVQTAGWHRPSDAIGAALLTFATIAVAAAILVWLRPVGTGRRTSHFVAYPVLGLVWIYAAAETALQTARALKILVNTTDSSRPRGVLLNEAYQFNINLTVLVVVSLLTLLLLLLGNYDLDDGALPPSNTAGSTRSTTAE